MDPAMLHHCSTGKLALGSCSAQLKKPTLAPCTTQKPYFGTWGRICRSP